MLACRTAPTRHARVRHAVLNVRAKYQVPTAIIFESGNERFKSASLASALVYIAIMVHPRASGTHQAARTEHPGLNASLVAGCDGRSSDARAGAVHDDDAT